MRLRYLVLALAGAAVLFGGGQAFAQAGAPSAGWSASDCANCHDKAAGAAFQKTKHGANPQSCASCHTDVAAHMKAQTSGDKNGPVPSLKKLTAAQTSEICLKCHEKGGQQNYTASMHARRNVPCTSCHSVHDPKSAQAQLKTKVDSELCFECHKPERAKAQRTSHHPVREGKMSCASCHNPHDGSRPKMILADSVNDLCYKCHAEKRGPFLFEHAPVREECTTCHEPHGTNHKRLLSQKLPNLCWNCHFTGSGHFAQNTAADNHGTEQGKYQVAPSGTTNFPTINSRMIEKSCKNCHVNLHGSNSPSGAAFLR
jgi:DmsE family decaheme c-type cytochrome